MELSFFLLIKELSNLLNWIHLPCWLSFNIVVEHRILLIFVSKNRSNLLIIVFRSSVRSLRDQLVHVFLQKSALFRFALLLSTRPTGVGKYLVIDFRLLDPRLTCSAPLDYEAVVLLAC